MISRKVQIPATMMSAINSSYSLLKCPNPTDHPSTAGCPISGVCLHTISDEFLPKFFFFKLSALSPTRHERGKRSDLR